jgi:hypothetical protein
MKMRVYAGVAMTTVSVYVLDREPCERLAGSMDGVELSREVAALGGSLLPGSGATNLLSVAVPVTDSGSGDLSAVDAVSVEQAAQVYALVRGRLLAALEGLRVQGATPRTVFHGLLPPPDRRAA